VDEVARANPGFLKWMLTKDFSPEVKAVAQQALKGARTTLTV
jgi:hypothetical protein